MCSAGRCWGRWQRILLWGVLLAAWEAAWGQLRYSVPEEMPKGSFVGDVTKDLGLQMPALANRGVRIIDRGRTQYFALHGKTGHLVTAERIDREQLCRLVEQCVLRCELIVEGEMKVYEIDVEITDINDNSPTFKDTEVEEKISEMNTPGSRFSLPRAHDPDSGQNSLQSYELSGDEHFSLAVQKGPGGDQRPELVLAKALDREEAAIHELVLRAIDGGDPARTGTARIRVTVVDANDNAPVFSQAEYTVRVPEDVPVGSTLVTVTATDADEGMNGNVRYSLKKETDMALDIFHLDSETGEITLMRSLDFEEGNAYEMEVQARDGGQLYDTAKVEITVTDINDNAPKLTVTSQLSEVSEDSPTGTVVALLHVQDQDSGANGEVRCSLDGDVPFLLEHSQGSYYRVVTARELDREQQSEYNVTVRASDGGWPALQSSRVLALRVLDVNDNAPVFSQEATLHVVLADSLQEALPELSERAAGAEAPAELQFYLVLALALLSALFVLSVALAVLARLRRAGSPAVLRCLGAQRFSLAGAAFPPDFCEGTLPYSYNLCVAAPARAAAEAAWPPPPLPILPAEELLAGEPCDKPILSSSAVAGEPPTDSDAPQCREEAAGAAVDREEREEGRSAAAPPAADRLDRWIAGFLGLKGVGFRSSRGADLCYSEAEGLVVEAESGKSEREQEPGHLSAARFLLWGVLLAAWEAAWGQLRYSVPEEMPKGSFVGDVAKDLGLQHLELGDRGVRILDKGRTQYFALHGKTGHLVTAERIDREQLCRLVEQCVLRCELMVEEKMQVYEIEVVITDINDNAPSFREEETQLRISETTTPGSRFPLPRAHDPDSGQNSLQSYELSGDEHFSLAVQTGPGGDQRPELVLAKALDREEAAFHELVLRAMDGGDPARTGTARIRGAALRGVPATHFVGIDGVRAFLHSYSHDVSLTADSRKSHLRFSAASCCDTLPARPPPDEPAPLLGEEEPAGDRPADPAPVSSSGQFVSAKRPC
ncbi:protocadherin gamma-A5-like, partial [Empidonax traillii]|uniref:protocadherin gamma-A5-like n=1 Tax=Empidonax traillii TaxID=164674 RepID=UPI000FFCFC0F